MTLHKQNVERDNHSINDVDIAIVFGDLPDIKATDVIRNNYNSAISYIKEVLSINRTVVIYYNDANKDEADKYFSIFNNEEAQSHPRMISTVDMVIITYLNNELCVGLKKRKTYPHFNKYAITGQFIHLDADTTTDDTIQRIQDQFMNMTVYNEQVCTIASCNRDLRGPNGWAMSVVYMALVSSDDVPFLEKQGIEFFPVTSLPTDIAFDHDIIIQKAIKRFKNKSAYTNIPMLVMPKQFSMTDLISVYENCVERKFDQSSFRRKIRERNLLDEVGKGKGKGSPVIMKNKVENIAVFDKNIV